MPVSSSTSRVRPSTTDSPSCTSMTPPGGDQSSDPSRRRFCTSKSPSGPSTRPPATTQSRTPGFWQGDGTMSESAHPNTEAVVAGAAAAGITIEPRRFPEGTRTAEDAAAAIGVPAGAIVKSLVFLVDDQPVLLLVSGAHGVADPARGAAAGGSAARRPFAAVVRDLT